PSRLRQSQAAQAPGGNGVSCRSRCSCCSRVANAIQLCVRHSDSADEDSDGEGPVGSAPSGSAAIGAATGTPAASPPTSPPAEPSGDEEWDERKLYSVEMVVDHILVRGKSQFVIKYQGYSVTAQPQTCALLCKSGMACRSSRVGVC